jgi:hypothetical protein
MTNHYTHATRATQGDLFTLSDAERVAETRRLLAGLHGQTWDAAELARDFELAEIVFYHAYVVRRADGVRGSLTWHSGADLFYGFQESMRQDH